MTDVKILDVKETILADNEADASRLRRENREKGLFFVNLMSSPGSGKTSVLLKTLPYLKAKGLKAGVLEADIDSDADARAIVDAGFPGIQLHTGGMCHLDASMSRQGLQALPADGLDIVFLENVGNLVCPAEFDTGAALDVVILSVPEGDDKPLKYPLMFEKCPVVLINKTDAEPAFDFSRDRVREAVLKRRSDAQIFFVSALDGNGIEEWTEALLTARDHVLK